MKAALIRSILSAAALLTFTSLTYALDATIKTPDVKGAAKASVESTKVGAKATMDSSKSAVKAKLVDINSVSEAELKAVPGIGDTYAAKIIAGRPYTNKTQLKTRNILPAPAYEKVKDLIVAKKAMKIK